MVFNIFLISYLFSSFWIFIYIWYIYIIEIEDLWGTDPETRNLLCTILRAYFFVDVFTSKINLLQLSQWFKKTYKKCVCVCSRWLF